MAYFKQLPAKNKQGYKWKCTIEGPPDPATGKRRQITRRADGKKEAYNKALSAYKEIEENNGQVTTEVTFNQYLNEWIETYKKGKVKPSTFESHKRTIKKHLLPIFGNMKIKKLDLHQYQKYINYLLETRKETTVKHINATMSNAMSKAVLLGLIIKNPCTGVVIKKIETEKDDKIHYWTKPEINQFLKKCIEDKMIYYYFFLTLIRTGIRKGEAMALQEEDIDFENNLIHINKTLLYHLSNDEDAFGPPKTDKSYRKIKIDDFLANELKKRILENKKNKLLFGDKYSKLNFVFCKPNGKRLRSRTLQTALERIMKKCEVSKICIHDMRHTHAVMLLESGVTLKEIQDRLGHKDIMTTGNIYSHVTEKMENEAVSKFAEYMADSNIF
ncbi:tyrosine-type recombinase/integrase [Bacillus massiliigorillae]|uniref:tyrosine-type recombinase/integrase n=1 Tax=Bacillus massiliigorillae TaxID=1243664 RepID=UPI0003A677C9|nr:site-specific integrase [Bacillus massiliigorillae]